MGNVTSGLSNVPQEWGVSCSHLPPPPLRQHGRVDDRDGNPPASHPSRFRNAMASAFYGPLESHRPLRRAGGFATPTAFHIGHRMSELKAKGAEPRVIFRTPGFSHAPLGSPTLPPSTPRAHRPVRPRPTGWARGCNPLTIESKLPDRFKSRTNLVPRLRHNSRTPACFLQADRASEGPTASSAGAFNSGASLWMTLRYCPDLGPSSFMPRYRAAVSLSELAGPLEPEMKLSRVCPRREWSHGTPPPPLHESS